MFVEDDGQESPLKFILSQLGITITSQPADASAVIGGTVSYSVAVADSFGGLVQFNWQVLVGSTYVDLAESTGFYEGVQTVTLTVKAIDNFMPARGLTSFRCRINYPGAAPIFSDPAALNVALYANSYPATFLQSTPGVAIESPPGTWTITSHLQAPTVFGFSGPFTYTWAKISGDNFINVAQSGRDISLRIGAAAAGKYSGFWRVTISNGIQSVVSDPIPVFGFGLSNSPLESSVIDGTDPSTADDGAALSAQINATDTWVGPWAQATFQAYRTILVPALTITTPAAISTTTSINTTSPVGGALIFWIWGAKKYNPQTTYDAALGAVNWGQFQ